MSQFCYRLFLGLSVLLLLDFGAYLLEFAPEAVCPPLDDGSCFQYREEHEISDVECVGFGISTAVSVLVDTTSLLSAGNISNCDELRFRQYGKPSDAWLGFFVENGCDLTETRIWVENFDCSVGASSTLSVFTTCVDPWTLVYSTELIPTNGTRQYPLGLKFYLPTGLGVCPAGWSHASEMDGFYLSVVPPNNSSTGPEIPPSHSHGDFAFGSGLGTGLRPKRHFDGFCQNAASDFCGVGHVHDSGLVSWDPSSGKADLKHSQYLFCRSSLFGSSSSRMMFPLEGVTLPSSWLHADNGRYPLYFLAGPTAIMNPVQTETHAHIATSMVSTAASESLGTQQEAAAMRQLAPKIHAHHLVVSNVTISCPEYLDTIHFAYSVSDQLLLDWAIVRVFYVGEPPIGFRSVTLDDEHEVFIRAAQAGAGVSGVEYCSNSTHVHEVSTGIVVENPDNIKEEFACSLLLEYAAETIHEHPGPLTTSAAKLEFPRFRLKFGYFDPTLPKGVKRAAVCGPGQNGEYCDYKCIDGEWNSDVGTVCSGHGSCFDPWGVCNCTWPHVGQYCERIGNCWGIGARESNVCSSQGKCEAADICACDADFTGSECEQPLCWGMTTATGACSNGVCYQPNQCHCPSGRAGEQCEFDTCFGVSSSHPDVCNAHGLCTSVNTCNCAGGYTGPECRIFNCGASNCSWPNGTCLAPTTCSCEIGYAGSDCEDYLCFGTLATSYQACSGHGRCAFSDFCDCETGYTGTMCEEPLCWGKTTGTGACQSHGSCVSPDECQCDSGFAGEQCDFVSCFGLSSENPLSSRACNFPFGSCVVSNSCVCNSGYYGDDCLSFDCDPLNCSWPNGTCLGPSSCVCESGYLGSSCESYSCYGGTVGSQYACGDHGGQCLAPDQCSCLDGYSGDECELFNVSCIDIGNCSNGSCRGVNYCECFAGYTGERCDLPECYGKSLTAACSSPNGTCVSPDFCVCEAGYSGKECGDPLCSEYCHGHGLCDIAPGICTCDPGWESTPQCEIATCHGQVEFAACSSPNGTCVAPNSCNCSEGFVGLTCASWMCFGQSNSDPSSTLVCNYPHGLCVSPDQCICLDGYYGESCRSFDCDGANLCSSPNGTCVGPDECSCVDGFVGTQCSSPTCYGKTHMNGPSPCNSHGFCDAPDICRCSTGFRGSECELPVCYEATGDAACSSHGMCVSPQDCRCYYGYAEPECADHLCFGEADSSITCSGRGTCVDVDTCVCIPGHLGKACELSMCSNVLSNSTSVCGGHGQCSDGECRCQSGYFGDSCAETTTGLAGIVGAVAGSVGLLGTVVFFFACVVLSICLRTSCARARVLHSVNAGHAAAHEAAQDSLRTELEAEQRELRTDLEAEQRELRRNLQTRIDQGQTEQTRLNRELRSLQDQLQLEQTSHANKLAESQEMRKRLENQLLAEQREHLRLKEKLSLQHMRVSFVRTEDGDQLIALDDDEPSEEGEGPEEKSEEEGSEDEFEEEESEGDEEGSGEDSEEERREEGSDEEEFVEEEVVVAGPEEEGLIVEAGEVDYQSEEGELVEEIVEVFVSDGEFESEGEVVEVIEKEESEGEEIEEEGEEVVIRVDDESDEGEPEGANEIGVDDSWVSYGDIESDIDDIGYRSMSPEPMDSTDDESGE